MAYIQDSTQSFTITLTAFLEGIGIITYILVHNSTDVSDYEWFNNTWYLGNAPQAKEGDGMEVYVDVLNDGETTDTLFAEFSSAQVTPSEALIQESSVVVGGEANPLGAWTFTMPGASVNITINAGHIE